MTRSAREPWQPQCPEMSGLRDEQCEREKGHEGMHISRVKACVNPAHLAVGTQRENSLDAQRKGLSAAPKIFCDKCGRQRKKFARGLACERCRSEIGKAAWRERRARLIAGRIEARKRSSPQRPKLVYSALVQLVGERNAEMYARNYALYQFSDAVPMHLSELGELYGVSRERCRQIISRTGEIAGGTGRTFWAPLRGK